MNKLQKLKDIIRIANPKLIVMKVKISEEEFAQITNGTDSFDYTKYLVYPDITISSIMVAIEKTFELIAIETNGEFIEYLNLDQWERVGKHWDLTHDNLDWHAKHRPDVVEFLEDLLI